MTDLLILKPQRYHTRMSKFALIPRHMYAVSGHIDLKEMILKYRMSGMDESILDLLPSWIEYAEKMGRPLKISEWRAKAEKDTRDDIEEYLPILYNQALIMICTVFDVFLVDSLKVITTKQPNILKLLADKGDINIAEIIDFADYTRIFETIQTKVLDRFDFKGIKDKIEMLKKIGVDIEGIFRFKFHKKEVMHKYPDGYQILVDCYEKRNDIVHRDKLPFVNHEHLDYIADYFSHLIMSVGWEMGEHFDIPTDFDLPRVIKMSNE